jgi:Protein of unknown function (DUF3263)
MLAQAHRDILRFEEDHPENTGTKKDLILFEFGLTSAQYHSRLRFLSTQQDAVAAFPMVCKRIQRQVRRRSAQREMLLELGAS